MARNLSPKAKQSRRAGADIGIKSKILVKRNYPPGMHGQRVNRRVSAYGTQLREKQKAKAIYRLLERQFVKYYERAIRKQGNTGEILLQLLETRLDNVVFRLGFAPSRDTARQLISHGHFLVNGRKLTIPSYEVKVNDLISVHENRKESAYWQDVKKLLTKNTTLPSWLTQDVDKLEGRVERLPAEDDLKLGIEMPQIVEFYSR
ncbi:MAG: 30S ribosomal protein S4 [Candidatus Nomurabacteria bacterium]|nr:MAG: 30S ribosomal protein S4 [Candidatus Nomurabacteria bacterium]